MTPQHNTRLERARKDVVDLRIALADCVQIAEVLAEEQARRDSSYVPKMNRIRRVLGDTYRQEEEEQ